MNNPFAFPGCSEMMSQINAFQKDHADRMMKTVNDAFGDKNPMVEGFSEFSDTLQNTFKGLLDISKMVMPDLSQEGKNPFVLFVDHLPEIPAQIMKKLLEIPPVGITRPYQEKINMVLDKLALYNAAAMEFLYCTFVPVEEATRMTIKEIMKQSESMKSLEDSQKLYEKWLKLLEEEYQSLFKTDRYKHVIAKIMSAMGEYRAASRELVLDLIHLSGLPFGREVEELSKDVFDLKKKIKTMEAQMKKMEKIAVHA